AGVQLLGVDSRYWQLGDPPIAPRQHPGRRQIVINRTLADAIGLEPGERLLVRLPRPSAVAGDSLMADKDETVRSLTDLEVADVIPARGLGRFSLTPTQQEVTLAVLAL